MKTAITAILLIAVATWTTRGQQYDCHRNLLHYKITNDSGVKLLSDWRDGSDVITTLAKGTVIAVCGQTTYDYKKVKAFYKDTVGYVKKEFIEIQKSVNVVILNRWVSDVFPITEKYYGIFDRKNQYGRNVSTIEECSTKIDSIKTNDGTHYHIVKLHQDDIPRIMISGLDVTTGTQNNGRFFDSKFLYPGEAIQWSYSDNQYLLYAKGEIVEDTVTTSINAFSKIRNYEFHVRRQVNGVTTDKILYKMDFRSWSPIQYEGGVNLHWIGDIDGDKELDMILTVSNHYACWEVSLFLSSQAESDYFFKEVTKYQDCGS